MVMSKRQGWETPSFSHSSGYYRVITGDNLGINLVITVKTGLNRGETQL